MDEGSGSRSPRGRRRCSCSSPGDSRRVNRSESLTSISSAASALPCLNERLVAGALEATTTLLASQVSVGLLFKMQVGWIASLLLCAINWSSIVIVSGALMLRV